MPTPVLYCADPLNPRRVDEHFAPEAHEVRALGGQVALIDHDALLRGDADRAVERVPAGLPPAWYRGWMIPSEHYAALDEALRSRGAALLVSPDRYQTAHELPGWYPTFAGETPNSVWRPCEPDQAPSADDLAALAAALSPGPGIVKDYVKSRKHEWDQACFVPDITDTTGLTRVVRTFVELQGESLAGGIVLREFESFVDPEGLAAEVRLWWLDGEPRLLTPHPDSPFLAAPAPELDRVGSAVALLACRFVTTDLARRQDGSWRVIEVGDAQVSDLHAAIDRASLAAVLVGA